MKVSLSFLLIIFLTWQNAVICDMNFFKPVFKECNNTFPVAHEFILNHNNIHNLAEKIKSDRNGKCHIHCIFHKLNFIDNKGSVNKSELFANVKNVWEKIPDDKKEAISLPVISPELKEILSSYIGSCEAEDSVAQESDPCNKFYNFVKCIIKDIPETGL